MAGRPRKPLEPINEYHGFGSKCSVCGGRVRYLKTHSCVACNRVRHAKRHVKLQREKNVTYNGAPCKRCNSTVRYSKGGHCVACSINRAKERIKNYQPNDTDKEFAKILYADDFTIEEIKTKLSCSANQIREYLGLPLWQKPSSHSQPSSSSLDATKKNLRSPSKVSSERTNAELSESLSRVSPSNTSRSAPPIVT